MYDPRSPIKLNPGGGRARLDPVEIDRFYQLLDARPFRPFVIDLVNGRTIRVDHPENVFLFPYRERLKEILVYYPEPDDYSVIFPEGITALHIHKDGNGNGHDEPA